jgi:hypothetical protein
MHKTLGSQIGEKRCAAKIDKRQGVFNNRRESEHPYESEPAGETQDARLRSNRSATFAPGSGAWLLAELLL